MSFPTDTAGFHILDTTLRDGEQTPGVVFSLRNKLAIAEMLDRSGIKEVETGTPAMGEEEIGHMKTLSLQGFNFKTLSWCRALKSDIDLAFQTMTDGVHLSFPVSPIHLLAMEKSKDWVFRTVRELIPYALDHAGYVTVGALDASRTDRQFLKEFIGAVSEFPVRRMRIADTVGILNPFSTHELISDLHHEFPSLSLEFHGHNDLGMATANSLAAFIAGATCVDTTINGLGERAGNTPFEEIIMAMKFSANLDLLFDTSLLGALSEYVAIASGVPLSASKPVTGTGVLKHESGIHTDLIMKNRNTFQVIPAALVGREEEEFVFGKHSGFSACKEFLFKNKLYLSDNHCYAFVSKLKLKSSRLKRNLTHAELLDLARYDFPE